MKRVEIEIFTSSVCRNCLRANRLVEQLIKEVGFENVVCRKIDVIKNIDYAVAHGILSTPSIVIDGLLTFTALPSKQQLCKAIHSRTNRKSCEK